MVARTLYFDESGFTGDNLLDSTQPIFAIASTDLEPEVAEVILRETFPRYGGNEFKFSNIWRSRRNRANLPEFCRRMSSSQEHLLVWWVDKRFAVLTKIVDFLIEPLFSTTGYDFYADGFSLKYTNYIHFGLTQFAEGAFLDSLLRAYQQFSRDPTPQGLRNLQVRLRVMVGSSKEPVRVFLEQMALGADIFALHSGLDSFRHSDDLQLTVMLAMVGHWRDRYSEDFEVVHDESSNFFGSRDLWNRATNPNVPTQLVPTAQGTTYQFPLRVVSTTGVDSKSCIPVQFCDVLAGLTRRFVDTRTEGSDRKLLDAAFQAGLHTIDSGCITPEPVFQDEFPPRRRAGPDAADRMTEILFGPHNPAKG